MIASGTLKLGLPTIFRSSLVFTRTDYSVPPNTNDVFPWATALVLCGILTIAKLWFAKNDSACLLEQRVCFEGFGYWMQSRAVHIDLIFLEELF